MTILDYGAQLSLHSPCEEGVAAYNRCKSRKDVFKLIGQANVCDYFLQSIEEGWGPTPDDVESIFRPYINGGMSIKHVDSDRAIKIQVWCKADEVTIDDDIRWLVLVGCEGRVIISDWQVVKIFVDTNSVVEIDASPNSIVFVSNYGGKVKDVNGNIRFRTR